VIGWAALCIGVMFALSPVLLGLRRPGGHARSGSPFLAASAAILALGFYWMTPLGALAALSEARQAGAPTAVTLDCSKAAQAIALISDASDGVISVTKEGEVKLPGAVWARVPNGERNSLLSIARKTGDCFRGDHAARGGRAVDKDTGEVLAWSPAD
jgi:hypothetical protein